MLRLWDVNDLSTCWKLYIEGTKLSEPTEDIDLLPGDDALILGCYTLVKKYNITSNSLCLTQFNLTEQTTFLLQAALCLEAGLQKSKHNFQFKLLLIRIYIIIGLPLSPLHEC